MTRPDWKAEAEEIVRLVHQFGGGAAFPITLKLELAYETGRGAGLDEAQAQLADALGKLGRKPS